MKVILLALILSSINNDVIHYHYHNTSHKVDAGWSNDLWAPSPPKETKPAPGSILDRPYHFQNVYDAYIEGTSGERGYYLCTDNNARKPSFYLRRGRDSNRCKWKIYEIYSLHGADRKLQFICKQLSDGLHCVDFTLSERCAETCSFTGFNWFLHWRKVDPNGPRYLFDRNA